MSTLLTIVITVTLTIALIFILTYLSKRWESTSEGRHIMGTTMSIAAVATAVLSGSTALQVVAWACLAFALSTRLHLLVSYSRNKRKEVK